MRISDWSSDVCSSDLAEHVLDQRAVVGGVADETRQRPAVPIRLPIRIGRDAELDEERRPRSRPGAARDLTPADRAVRAAADFACPIRCLGAGDRKSTRLNSSY